MLPRRHSSGLPARGFSLVEILLVLAMVALLGTLLLPGINSLLRAMSEEQPDRLVLDSVNLAREQALTANRTVRLGFDATRQRLFWSDDVVAHHRVLPSETSVQFLQIVQGRVILLGGQLVETQVLSAVRFYPNGTCDAFRVQLRRGPAAPQIIVFDPWTCAPMFGAQP